MPTSNQANTLQNQKTIEKIKHHLIKNERSRRHPYLDSDGKVTIGVGFLIETEQEFLALTLRNKNTRKSATPAEKKQAWRAIKNAPKGRNAAGKTAQRPLKEDGKFGPVTGERLREAIALTGTDDILETFRRKRQGSTRAV